MGKRSWTNDLAIIVILLLIMGRIVNFPVALFLVSGQSMYPVLNTGDLVIGEAVYLTDYHVGDIVIWYRTFSYGVIHEVIEIRDGTVITKGINNPAPDPPVPSSIVRYKVVFHIPRYVWIPCIIVIASLYAYYRRKDLVSAFKSPELETLTIAGWILTFFIFLDIGVVFLSTIYYDSYKVTIQPPSVSLRSVKLQKDKPLVEIGYSIKGTYITGIENCSVSVGNTIFECSKTSYTSNTVYAGLPRQAIVTALKQSGSTSSLTLQLKITFKGGNLTGKYRVIVPWKPLVIKAAKGSIIVTNPNYIPVNITIEIHYYTVRNGIILFLDKTEPRQITVPANSAKAIEITEKGSFARVLVTYTYKPGSTRVIQEVVKVEFTQG